MRNTRKLFGVRKLELVKRTHEIAHEKLHDLRHTVVKLKRTLFEPFKKGSGY